MGALAWVMMGVALWHVAIFIPDRFWGGIVGSFVLAAIGALVGGFVLAGFTVPGNDDMSLLTATQGLPGALIGLAAAYGLGVRRGNEALHL